MLIRTISLLLLLLPSLAWGATAVDTLYPTGEGATSDWTNNGCTNSWECVDESVGDSSTTAIRINSTPGSNVIHQFTFEDPTAGTIDSAWLYWLIGYDTGPARQIDVRFDTGAGMTLVGDYDISTSWVLDSVKFTSPDSQHIADLIWEIENLETAKSTTNYFEASWVQIRYWYDDGAGGGKVVQATNVTIID